MVFNDSIRCILPGNMTIRLPKLKQREYKEAVMLPYDSLMLRFRTTPTPDVSLQTRLKPLFKDK